MAQLARQEREARKLVSGSALPDIQRFGLIMQKTLKINVICPGNGFG